MKIKRIAAVISAAAVALALTGCGNDTNANDLFGNNPQSGQALSANSKPAGNKPASLLPDIPVTDASAFDYKYDSELGGMVITNYKLENPKIHIPDKMENEKVVGVDLHRVEKDLTHIIMPDTVKEFNFSDQTDKSLQFFNFPDGVTDWDGVGYFNGLDNTEIFYKGKTYTGIYTVLGVMKYGEEKGLIYPKIVSADKAAEGLIDTVKMWVEDDVVVGGDEKYACDLRISMNNGTATISESKTSIPGESGSDKKNDWEGKKGAKGVGCSDSLKERFETTYPGQTFSATVFLYNYGLSGYSWYVPDIADYNGAAPTAKDLKERTFLWDSGMDGLLSTGEVVGTYPKISSDE